MNNIFEESFSKLKSYIEKENFAGYDPYDTLNAKIPFKYLGKWPAAIVTQLQKRNPINIRPILGIKKEINPKAFGLLLQAYSILYSKTKNVEYLKKANYFFEWLKNNNSKGYSGYCWGYNFPWANPTHYYQTYTPSSVVTSFVCKGIHEYYKISANDYAKSMLISSSDFILKDIPCTVDKNGICFSYTPAERDLCYNSSLLAAEVLAMAHVLTKNTVSRETVISAVNWVISKQKKDGRWNYSQDIISSKEREQVDFHQGYILESIYNIKTLLNIDDEKWEESLKRGMIFYFEKQFTISGSSYWRYPQKYPVEIHNQSQGIITLMKLKEYYPDALQLALKIATWTINNMQAKDGHFYYQNFRYYKHKISYMRWSNVWMFVALSFLLLELKINIYEEH